jgi:peroxiredoxin
MIKKITSLVLILLLSGCFANEKKEEKSSDTKTAQPSSLFTLKTIKGQTIHIDETQGGLTFHEFKDKATIFVFFGYRCPPCLREIPELIALKNEKHKDLAIVGLEVQGLDPQGLTDFAQRHKINYPLISAKNNNNFISYVAQRANWQGAIPFLLGFDKKGVVQVVHTGGITKVAFEKIYTMLTSQSTQDQNLTHK